MPIATSAFAPLISGANNFTRKWGGTQNSVDPFISGYFFVRFSYLPPALIDNIRHAGGPDNLGQIGDVKSVLAASSLAVTIPGGTVNKAEFIGLGGVKWAVPTNVDWDNTVTVRFLEFSGLPIHAIFHGWVRMIRDYRAGVSNLNNGSYSKSDYAATMYYWTTRPDGQTVEYAACITGMYPMKDPTDQMGADITTYDKLEIDIDFNADYIWHEPWVMQNCQALANSYYSTAYNGLQGGGAVDSYGQADGVGP